MQYKDFAIRQKNNLFFSTIIAIKILKKEKKILLLHCMQNYWSEKFFKDKINTFIVLYAKLLVNLKNF